MHDRPEKLKVEMKESINFLVYKKMRGPILLLYLQALNTVFEKYCVIDVLNKIPMTRECMIGRGTQSTYGRRISECE
jgi:hypothetical protein